MSIRRKDGDVHRSRRSPADAGAYQPGSIPPDAHTTSAVAVVGAGISGLACARSLADRGVTVTIFERSSEVGGRMSTRRAAGGLSFDHGAQYFTAREGRFARFVGACVEDGAARPWSGRVAVMRDGEVVDERHSIERFVAVPEMSGLCTHLATELDVRTGVCVGALERTDDGWRLFDQDRVPLGAFDAAVVAAPPLQSAALLGAAPALAGRAAGTRMHGCVAVMLALAEPLQLGVDGAFVHGSPLAWVARNSSKPGRSPEPETWVLHASPEWSRAHIDDRPEEVEAALLDAFWTVTGAPPAPPHYAAAHRWRFAVAPDPLGEQCLFDAEARVGACGDWCAGGRVEGAYLSGVAIADRIASTAAPGSRNDPSGLCYDPSDRGHRR